MRLVTSLLCLAATQDSSGLLNVLGGGFDTIQVPPGLPLGTPVTFQLTVVARFAANRTECGRPHEVELVLATQDGTEVSRLRAQLTPTLPPGHPMGWDVNVNLLVGGAFQLPGLGEYAFNLLADNAYLVTLPLRVIENPGATPVQPPPAPPQPGTGGS